MMSNGAKRAMNSEACISPALPNKWTLFVVMDIWHGTSDPNSTIKRDLIQNVTFTLNLFNGLVNTVAPFEVARMNRGQPLYHSVCMEYIDIQSYDITEWLESHYDMWDCCFIQTFSCGKQMDDQRATY